MESCGYVDDMKFVKCKVDVYIVSRSYLVASQLVYCHVPSSVLDTEVLLLPDTTRTIKLNQPTLSST
jgi:hypothetical protein